MRSAPPPVLLLELPPPPGSRTLHRWPVAHAGSTGATAADAARMANLLLRTCLAFGQRVIARRVPNLPAVARSRYGFAAMARLLPSIAAASGLMRGRFPPLICYDCRR